jgi:hypothetical protein
MTHPTTQPPPEYDQQDRQATSALEQNHNIRTLARLIHQNQDPQSAIGRNRSIRALISAISQNAGTQGSAGRQLTESEIISGLARIAAPMESNFVQELARGPALRQQVTPHIRPELLEQAEAVQRYGDVPLDGIQPPAAAGPPSPSYPAGPPPGYGGLGTEGLARSGAGPTSSQRDSTSGIGESLPGLRGAFAARRQEPQASGQPRGRDEQRAERIAEHQDAARERSKSRESSRSRESGQERDGR